MRVHRTGMDEILLKAHFHYVIHEKPFWNNVVFALKTGFRIAKKSFESRFLSFFQKKVDMT